MMIDWIPWLLIVLGWHQDTPEDQQLISVEVVVDQEECETLGARYLGKDGAEAEDLSDTHQYRILCTPMPDRASFNAALERWKQQSREKPQPE